MIFERRLEPRPTQAAAAITPPSGAAGIIPGRDDRRRAKLAALQSACQEISHSLLKKIDGWAATFEPRDAIDECLLDQIIRHAKQFAVVKRAQPAYLRKQIEETATRDRYEVEHLGQQLLLNPRGPAGIISAPRFSRAEPDSQESVSDRTSEPAALVEKLESTAAGCRWLLDRWAELHANLVSGSAPDPDNKFKITRLLGKQPLDALDDPKVAEVFLASHALDQRQRNAFTDLRSDLCVGDIKARLLRMQMSATSTFKPLDGPRGRERLIVIINRAEGAD